MTGEFKETNQIVKFQIAIFWFLKLKLKNWLYSLIFSNDGIDGNTVFENTNIFLAKLKIRAKI